MNFNNTKNNNLLCKKCKNDFIYRQEETYWDENGTVSTKLVKCPYCQCPNVIKHWEVRTDKKGINYDMRYYAYR